MKLNERMLELMNSFLRIGSVIVVLVLEMVLIISPVVFLQRSAISVYLNLQLFSVPLIYVMVNKEPRYKLNWVLIIFLIPAGGFILYFLWGSKREFSWFNRRFRRAEHEIGELLPIRMETETRCYEDFPNEAPHHIAGILQAVQ